MKKKKPSQPNQNKSTRIGHHSRKTLALIAACAFIAGIILGAFAFGKTATESTSLHEVRQGSYSFINPLLECEHAEDSIREQALQPFKYVVEDRIRALTKKGDITYASVYYRDLNTGPWIGINEREGYIPASLLKVATMISVLQIADSDRGILKKKLLYTSPGSVHSQNIPVTAAMVPGNEYTIDDLLRRLIAYSDNNAIRLLTQFTGTDHILRIYKDLGINFPNRGENSELSVKEYASFFRILFNASYLSRDMSEKALSYLAQSEFKKGIVAGVPSSVSVAHKFGEREIRQSNGAVITQFHDCGIVYYPDHPYLLCIMTRGSSFERQTEAIQDISRTVYSELARQYDKLSVFPASD